MIKLLLVGYFIIKFIDLDYDGKYNVLLEQDRTGNLVSYRQESVSFKEGEMIRLRIDAECDKTKVGEVLEGNGKRGSPWATEDDWYLNRMTYICNAEKVEILND